MRSMQRVKLAQQDHDQPWCDERHNGRGECRNRRYICRVQGCLLWLRIETSLLAIGQPQVQCGS